MKTNFSILTVAVLLAAGCSNKMLKEAERAYSNEQFASAAKIYENVVRENPNPETMLHLADCYRHMNRQADAENWYSKSINSNQATASDKLHYAEVLKEEGKYDEAISMFDIYLKTSPDDIAAKNQRASCSLKGEYEKVNPFYTVEKTDFGFSGSCFSPAKFGNDILVTASVANNIGAALDKTSGNSFFDLYVVSRVKKEIIANAEGTLPSPFTVTPLEGDVNSNLHEGPAVLSPFSKLLFFTRSTVNNKKAERAKDNDNHLELCTAELVNDKWTNIKSLPFNNKEYSVGHPALASNGTRLFFVSDMPGGFGGTDIYYSDFSNGAWSKPVNAGNTINTNGNEMFPSIRFVNAGSDEFYFSSDGLAGAGGLDLFRCKMENGIPVNPERMQAPFNSSYDDFGILFDADGNSGYFSSNRNSAAGKDDIYSFKRRDPKFFVKVNVVEKGSNIPFKQTALEIKTAKSGDNLLLKTDDEGAVIFPADSLTTYNFCIHNQEVFTCYAGVTTGGFKGTFSDTSFVTINVEKIVINKPIRLDNIYYDYKKWDIRPDAAVELDKLVKILIDNPQIKIELSSHTDSRGSDKYNMTLSQKRAQAAVDYIVSKGISRDRITAKGYGESVPLNRCVNGVKCTEEEWQFNRRTEFKVTKIIAE